MGEEAGTAGPILQNKQELLSSPTTLTGPPVTLRFLSLPDLCLVMCCGLGEEGDGTSSAPGQDLGPFSTPAPAQAPALPEALKGPDCAREVSERQFHEYMKESFVQVSRSGGWGLWAGGLPGSEGSSGKAS